MMLSFINLHHYAQCQMRPVVTDVACTLCLCVCLSVCPCVCLSVCLCICLLVITVNPAKADELIEVLFGLWTLLGPGNHVLG